jgi:hypothetical protein
MKLSEEVETKGIKLLENKSSFGIKKITNTRKAVYLQQKRAHLLTRFIKDLYNKIMEFEIKILKMEVLLYENENHWHR